MATSSIYNDAKSGKLKDGTLKQYIGSGEDINGANTTKKYTPLMVAVLYGRKREVKLLLSNNADADRQGADGETALWLAASKTTKNRQKIIALLLAANPKPKLDVTPNIGSGNTPLMEAIVQFEDADVVSMLVDAGADVNKGNQKGQTAQKLAEERNNKNLTVALLDADERKKHRIPVINRVRNFVSHLIAWVNIAVTAVAGALGSLQSLFGISGSKDASLPKDLDDCTTSADFKKNVDKYVEETGLERFFPKDSQFLQKLAEGLVAFKDSKSPLNTPENLHGLIKLSLYQTILFCDDSGSMESPTIKDGRIPRIVAQRGIVERITRICSLLVPDSGGIHVRFINKNVDWDKLNTEQVSQNMATVGARGGTNIGTRLREKVLQPYVYDHLDQGLERPYLVCIITDGSPYPESVDKFTEVLQECVETLEEKGFGDKVVSFIVCQIGDDAASKLFLDKLRDNQRIGDSVYVCKEQIDGGSVEFNKNDEDLEIRLFNILKTPLVG